MKVFLGDIYVSQPDYQITETTMDTIEMGISPGVSCWEEGTSQKGTCLPERDFKQF